MKAKTALQSLDGSQYLNGSKENRHFELTLERRQQAFVWVLHFWVHTRNEVKRIRLNSISYGRGQEKRKATFNLIPRLICSPVCSYEREPWLPKYQLCLAER